MEIIKKISVWNIITLLLILFFLWKQIPIWLAQNEIEEGSLTETIFVDAAGKKFTLPDDRPAVLIFWATWCGPCKIEMMHFDTAIRMGLDGTRIFAINLGEDPTLVSQYWSEHKHSMQLAFDHSGSLAEQLRVMATPTLAMIDPNGRIEHISSGLSFLGPLRSAIFLNQSEDTRNGP